MTRRFQWQLFSVRSDGCSVDDSCDAGCVYVPAHGVSLNDHWLGERFLGVWSLLPSMRLLRVLRPYLCFLPMLRLLGPAALVPWVFAIAFAALSVIFAFRKQTSLSGRIQAVPLDDDQALDDFEADHNVWNDLLQLLVHHAIAPFLVPALDDSTECSLALTCHFALDVFTVMQHGLVWCIGGC